MRKSCESWLLINQTILYSGLFIFVKDFFLDLLKSVFYYSPQSPLIFTTYSFWIFFLAVLLVFQGVYKKRLVRNLFLSAFSLFFYYKSSGFFFVLLLFTTLWDYIMGRLIFKENILWKRKLFVGLSITANLALLAYFKYTYFLVDIINQLSHTSSQPINIVAWAANNWFGQSMDINSIILPVGISFYTFQSISYCIDIFRKEIEPVNNFFDYTFFVSFFPQLVAGPIVRASDFVPQIYLPYSLTREEFGRALYLILAGLCKKIVISDYISANFVDRVFENPLVYTGLENLMAVYGYAIQIYCDFSGYTDIAIGVALLLGFRLTINFNSPYQAINITDFWRRWHVSLSTWLKDYLYIPLGGNRKGAFRTYFNLFLTMLLGGLWHGAHLRFIIWGALHGVALAIHKFYTELVGPSKNPTHFFTKFACQLLTFHFVAFCWIFFRAESLESVFNILNRIFYHFQADIAGQMIEAYRIVIILIVLGFVLHLLPRKLKYAFRNLLTNMPMPLQAISTAIIVLLIYQIKSAEMQPFIYFQF